jgi:hypothetical protein
MDPTNSIVWTRKSFIGSLVSCGVGFQQNSGQQSMMDPSCQHNFLGHQQTQGHNKQESTTTFILPYGSNKQHCMDKEEFHWIFGVVRGWFSAKFGSKIHDGSQLSAQFPWPPTDTGTQQTGINHFYSSSWIQQTALYGQGRVSLALWCRVGLVFSKTQVKNQ